MAARVVAVVTMDFQPVNFELKESDRAIVL